MASTKVSLKLLIDTSSKKVLFAEAGKDFVDFLFNLLALPVGTVIRLLTKDSMVGRLGNLYGSIEELSHTYLQTIYTKESILNPKASGSAAQVQLLPADNKSHVATSTKIYTCSRNERNVSPYDYCHDCGNQIFCGSNHVSTDPNTVCPTCNNSMSQEMTYIGGLNNAKVETGNPNGFVKGVVTYMVMDNLVVKPMSTISSITMLTKFDIKDVGTLEEKNVYLDMALGLKLLKASLHSEAVLTTVFL